MMIERIRPWVQGKKVLILGFGREGKSTWNVLKKLDCCSFVDVADMAEPKEKPEGIRNWIAGLFRALIFSPGSYSLAAWATGYFVTCLPGLVIQLVLVPSIVFALMKARLVPMRYSAKH